MYCARSLLRCRDLVAAKAEARPYNFAVAGQRKTVAQNSALATVGRTVIYGFWNRPEGSARTDGAVTNWPQSVLRSVSTKSACSSRSALQTTVQVDSSRELRIHQFAPPK